MPKRTYNVEVAVTLYTTISVEAERETQAQDLAIKQVQENGTEHIPADLISDDNVDAVVLE